MKHNWNYIKLNTEKEMWKPKQGHSEVQQTYHLLQQVLDLQSTYQFKEMYGESNIIQQWHRLLTNTVKSCVFWGTSPAAAPCWSDILRCRIEPWSILLQNNVCLQDAAGHWSSIAAIPISAASAISRPALRRCCAVASCSSMTQTQRRGARFLNFFSIFLKSDPFETDVCICFAFH